MVQIPVLKLFCVCCISGEIKGKVTKTNKVRDGKTFVFCSQLLRIIVSCPTVLLRDSGSSVKKYVNVING